MVGQDRVQWHQTESSIVTAVEDEWVVFASNIKGLHGKNSKACSDW